MHREMLSNAWDTHVHLFNPTQFPYKPNRAYTPPIATGQGLIARSKAKNFLLVQATIENGSNGLLQQAQTLQNEYPDRAFRVTLLFDKAEALSWTYEDLENLHDTGVRCLRIHGKFGSDGSDIGTIKHLLLSAATVARQIGWAISAQLPLQLWASLETFITVNMAGVPVVAEHCASINVPMSPTNIEAFRALCIMLEKKLIYVKLGALHRRNQGAYDHDLVEMLSKIAVAGPGQLLWGSDWPHVDSTARGITESEFLSVDEKEELEILSISMAGRPEILNNMLNVTPKILFY